ncbi:MAG TPA: 3-hydroxyacyl-CoA dehydrogenase/enoyl-CoA hydratase family protein [Candidatus Acidoferrum sp.]|nr:3-hydroxyacyl-CoA dehydrogenase/enoyl-CoA hydratase family protein [Candidatus Acidoferrum sp.]
MEQEQKEAPIRRVAVLGAGVMGSGIAAHIANAGHKVLLLDIVPPDLPPAQARSRAARDRIAATAVANLGKTRPAPLFAGPYARLISIGNLEDDLAAAGQCDLVIEAVVERLDIKRALYARLEPLLGEGTILATNTSGLRIADLLAGRADGFRRRFLVTHFFNPPRYMKLLEVVAGPDTDPSVVARAEGFGREVLGKGIVRAKDTPNFIANRIGAHAMMTAIRVMLERGLAPEDIDALTGEAMAHPKSATFRTGDVVGLDTMAHVVQNCYQVLTSDEERAVFEMPPYIRAMLEQNRLGDKTRGGFYRKADAGIETLDPGTGQYRARGGNEAIARACKKIAAEPDARKRVRALVAAEGEVGTAAWSIMARSLAYAARRVGEISDDVASIDAAMRWGYSWELGPFETWDALGVRETVARMEKDGIAVAPAVTRMLERGIDRFYDASGRVFDLAAQSYRAMERDPREVTLTVLRRGEAAVLANAGAEAWDVGDGVLCLTYKTKANSIDPDVTRMLHDAVARAERDFRALLIANEGDHYSVGANLFLVAMGAGQKQWEQIRQMVALYQGAVQRLKYASVPVVTAPYGMTLGGGLEFCLGATQVQAAAETYAGLVEVGVGLIPGGAGNMNLLWRALENIPQGVDYDPFPFVAQVFKNIATAQVATSAGEAIELGYFRRTDGVSFDRARQLWEAKRRAIALAESGHHPPVPRAFRLPGESGIATLHLLINTMMQSGYASPHDGVVARQLARVLCGGASGATHEVSEDEMLELEREAFVSLCGEPKSQERMQHMLMHNKPLRN